MRVVGKRKRRKSVPTLITVKVVLSINNEEKLQPLSFFIGKWKIAREWRTESLRVGSWKKEKTR